MFRYRLTIFLFQGVGGGLGFLFWTNVFVFLRVHAFFVGFFFFLVLLFVCLFIFTKGKDMKYYVFFFFLQKHINPPHPSKYETIDALTYIESERIKHDFHCRTLNLTSLRRLKFMFNLFVTSILIDSCSL